MKPGPGQYCQTIDFKKSMPIFSIGKEDRMGATKKNFNPGPGAYRNQSYEIGKGSPQKSISHKLKDLDKIKKD